MKIIFDADSLIYASCFKNKEDRVSKEDMYETDITKAFDKFSSSFGKLIEHLDEIVLVEEVVFCNGSKNNFRNTLIKLIGQAKDL